MQWKDFLQNLVIWNNPMKTKQLLPPTIRNMYLKDMQTGLLTTVSANYTTQSGTVMNNVNNVCVCDNLLLEAHFYILLTSGVDFTLSNIKVDVILATNVKGTCTSPYYLNFINSAKFTTIDLGVYNIFYYFIIINLG